MQFREFTFERADGDEIPAVLSTDTPVDRGSYVEILEHSAEAIDLQRAPLPLIDSHDSGAAPYGVVEQLRIAGGKLRGVVRFGNSARAKELFADVKAGILRSLSIGYQIIKHRLEGDRSLRHGGCPSRRVVSHVPQIQGRASIVRSNQS